MSRPVRVMVELVDWTLQRRPLKVLNRWKTSYRLHNGVDLVGVEAIVSVEPW